MKNKIVLLITLFFGFFANAQTWLPVGSGITGTGSNTTWSLFAYDSVLYAGGWFDTAGGIPVRDMAQWNGSGWSNTGSGSEGYINAMASYNGFLYAGGEFDSIGRTFINDIARWNGSQWSAVGKGIKDVQYGVYAMAIYNGNLYAGGSFDSAGGKLIYGIAQWNDTNWSALGTGIYAADEDDGIFAMAVYNGELYAAGNFDSAGGVPIKNIARWNGTKWSDVGGGTNALIYSLCVYNGNLYAGGMFDSAGGMPANDIAMWNGSNWLPLDSGISGEAGWSAVNSMASYNGELYAGGYFDTVNNKPVNCIARWNGSRWSGVGSGINVGGAVSSMAVYNNALYVGGGFDSAGGVYTKNIAMWTNLTGIRELGGNNGITLYPNPVNKTLSIKMKDVEPGMHYTVYNELGQAVGAGSLLSSQTNTIDVGSYSPGIYMILISGSNELYSRKFVKY